VPLEDLLVNRRASALDAVWLDSYLAGRRLRSPGLIADGRHLLADVVSSGGVAVGLLLAVALDLPVLDPKLAVLVVIKYLIVRLAGAEGIDGWADDTSAKPRCRSPARFTPDF
jgi:hypothetical protein